MVHRGESFVRILQEDEVREARSTLTMSIDKNTLAFLELLRVGLWSSGNTHRRIDISADWEKVYQLAVEQSVAGVVLAGVEQLRNSNSDLNIPQKVLLQWIGEVQMLEQQNLAMNKFVAQLIERLRREDIYVLLVKGQGIAQCYEKPLWRPSGDVDLLLSDANYKKAKDYLLPLSSRNKHDERYSKHLGMNISQWYVEIHGTLRTGLTGRIDRVVDDVQKDAFYGGQVRAWNNGKMQVFLPSPDNDVFFVFTHFIKHFYKEGMNLRQICDWCRLLWTYRDSLNHELLESRIRKAGLISEWNAFAALAVDFLGMPAEAMPLYDVKGKMSDGRYNKKAELILKHILKSEPYSKVRDTWAIAKIFPWNTFKFAPAIFLNVNGLKIKERLFN